MAAASLRQIGFLCLDLEAQLRDRLEERWRWGSLELKEDRPWGRGQEIASVLRDKRRAGGTLDGPGLTRADTGAGRVCHSTTRRLPAVGGHETIPAGAVWQP